MAGLVIWVFLFATWRAFDGNKDFGDGLAMIAAAVLVGPCITPFLVFVAVDWAWKIRAFLVSEKQIEVTLTFDAIDRAMKHHRLEEAMELAIHKAREYPEDPRVWMKIAEVYVADDNSQQAIPALEKALELCPDDNKLRAALFLQIADIYLDHLQQIDKGRKILLELMQLELTGPSARAAALRLQSLDS
ncbi:tetratricopeptide repeat protein [Planctomycetota bacterium]